MFIELEDSKGIKRTYKLNTDEEKPNDTPRDLFCLFRRTCYIWSWTFVVGFILMTVYGLLATYDNARLYQANAELKTQLEFYHDAYNRINEKEPNNTNIGIDTKGCY